jgi:hypothetical protein
VVRSRMANLFSSSNSPTLSWPCHKKQCVNDVITAATWSILPD